MTIRHNFRALTAPRRAAFVNAVLELKRRGGYDPFVRIHLDYLTQDSDDGPRAAHRAPSFLPWHRELLLRFEQALQDIDPSVSLPYWDWTADNSAQSTLWAADFMGGTGRSGDLQVTTGPFAYGGGNWPLAVRVDSRPFLRRSLGASGPLPTRRQLTSVLASVPYDMAPYNSTSPGGFRNLLEGWRGPNLHNRVHLWVGGTMTAGDSPNDPVFWLHHCFLDKLWADWQGAHPEQGYQPLLSTPDVIAATELMPPWKDRRPLDLWDHRPFYTYG